MEPRIRQLCRKRKWKSGLDITAVATVDVLVHMVLPTKDPVTVRYRAMIGLRGDVYSLEMAHEISLPTKERRARAALPSTAVDGSTVGTRA